MSKRTRSRLYTAPRWRVLALTSNGKTQVITRQPTRDDAIAKTVHAYPGCKVLDVRPVDRI